MPFVLFWLIFCSFYFICFIIFSPWLQFKVLDIDLPDKSSNAHSLSCFSCCSRAQHHDLVQRRMSDPSNELEKKLQSWKGKPLSKSRSANQVFNPEEESGINEVEATDFTEGEINSGLKIWLLSLNFLFCLIFLIVSIEMEEGDYDKLWDIPGFNQAFHFWKENKRASSPTFELFITYITLPFNFIMSDLLSAQQQKPILTF